MADEPSSGTSSIDSTLADIPLAIGSALEDDGVDAAQKHINHV